MSFEIDGPLECIMVARLLIALRGGAEGVDSAKDMSHIHVSILTLVDCS